MLFSLILFNTLTKLDTGLYIEPTNLPNNSFLGGMLANSKTFSFPMNLFSKIPPRILKFSCVLPNWFEILAGAISSLIPKTNANCPGITAFILFQKEMPDWPKAILTNVFLAIFKLHPASFNDFRKLNISFDGTFAKSTKTTDFCCETFSFILSICFVFCAFVNAMGLRASEQVYFEILAMIYRLHYC